MSHDVCASAFVGVRVFKYFRVVVFTTVGRVDVDSPLSSSVELRVALFVAVVVVFLESVVAIVFVCLMFFLFVRLVLVVYISCVNS